MAARWRWPYLREKRLEELAERRMSCRAIAEALNQEFGTTLNAPAVFQKGLRMGIAFRGRRGDYRGIVIRLERETLIGGRPFPAGNYRIAWTHAEPDKPVGPSRLNSGRGAE